MKITIKNMSNSTIYKVFDCIKCKDIDNYIQNLKTNVNIIIDNVNINNLGIHLKSSYINCVYINYSTITNLYIKIPKCSNIIINKSTISNLKNRSNELNVCFSNVFNIISISSVINVHFSRCCLYLCSKYVLYLNIYNSIVFLDCSKVNINTCFITNSLLNGVVAGISNSLISIINIVNTLITCPDLLKIAKQIKLKNTNLDFVIKDPIAI